ncbi:MAG: right-handed parallel beta-helix repeat-containing protein [Thermoplasmata archaeon]|nr:right-handed parallel beta-helix repeat-containing protein [Thermoplasmata archaeon]
MKKKASFAVIILVLIGSFNVILVLQSTEVSATTLYVGGPGPGNYSAIQDAVNVSTAGDTIFVYSGEYRERVRIDRSLTLLGEDKNTTIINAQMWETPMNISADWVNVSGFTFTNNGPWDYFAGIRLYRVKNCLVTDNNASFNSHGGITLFESSYNTISKNILWENGYGINLSHSSNNMIRENIAIGNSDGIALSSSFNNSIIGNDLLGNYDGVDLTNSYDNILSNNNASDNKRRGFHLLSSLNTSITGNNGWNNSVGVYVLNSDFNDISHNTFTNGRSRGIGFRNSVNNTISHNVILNNKQSGIQIYFSDGNNTITDNNVSNNGAGIILYYSNNSVVANNKAIYNNVGISLFRSRMNFILNNNVSFSNGSGIHLMDSNGNEMKNNTAIFNGDHGIESGWSSYNILFNNTCSFNEWNGIDLYSSDDNLVINNIISSNVERGIMLGISKRNELHHNKIIDNTEQAFDFGLSQWDNGYPSGGNYWSDYSGCDHFSGPSQDQPGSDGVGDTPYLINGGSVDRYPLIGHNPPSGCIPWSPENLQATAQNLQVTLTWDPPVYDGNSSITNYNVYRGTTSGTEIFLVQIDDVNTYIDTDVTNDRTYYYLVSAVNAMGEGPFSGEANATPSAPSANTYPTCRITTPSTGSVLSGTLVVTGTSSDSDGVIQNVEIRIDGGAWLDASGKTTWSFEWNTSTATNGEHTIYARSFDGENYSEEVDVKVVVDNPSPPTDQEAQNDWIWMALVSIIVIVVIVLLIVLMLIRRRKKSLEVEEPPEPPPQEPL